MEVKRVGDKPTVHRYNPRGWLSKTSSPLFNFSLHYDSPSERSNAQYNGNISEQVWTTGTDRIPHQYAYSYDRASRLLSGLASDGNGEILSYDKMGNINSLERTGLTSIPGASGTFVYDYGSSGNQLQSFTNGSSYTRNFQYNGQGSVVADGQMKTGYNELNLPKEITDYSNNIKVGYLYDAQGRKLTKQSPLEIRHYINGIEYLQNGMGVTIDLIHTEEGIARNIGGTYHHEYFLKDHLGNTRVVYNSAGAVLQQTDYYPFGMEINRIVSSPKMNYTYNGKELQQEIDQYDYGARFYDPVVGRWNVIDLLAEKYYPYSSYVYVINNPLKYIDPDGNDIIAVNAVKRDENGNYIYERNRVSTKTANAIKTLMSTKEGMDFFAQFARKGQIVFGHTFNESGKFSNHDLVIQDFSLQKETSGLNIPTATEGAFVTTVNKDKVTFYLQLMSFSQNESSLVETASHETQLHGYKVGDIIKALNEGGVDAVEKLLSTNPKGTKDHDAKRDKNMNHEGFRKYQSIRKQLSDREEKYKNAFDYDNN